MATTLRPDEFTDEDERWMRAALVEAEGALNRWEVPVGCVVVRDGEAVATGSNRTNELRNGTRHAEFEAIDALLKRHGGDPRAVGFDRCDLYVTCEPCIMCAGALSVLGFRKVYYGCGNDKFGGNGSILSIHRDGCYPCGAPGDAPGTSENTVPGDDNAGVPGDASPSFVASSNSSETPKSEIFTVPSTCLSRLSGFRSRWMIPAACR